VEFRRKLLLRSIYDSTLATSNADALVTAAIGGTDTELTDAAGAHTWLAARAAGLDTDGPTGASALAVVALVQAVLAIPDATWLPPPPAPPVIPPVNPPVNPPAAPATVAAAAPRAARAPQVQASESEETAVHLRPVVRSSKDAAGKLTSEAITDPLFKLAACPTKRAKCGPRVVDLRSHKSQPVELEISQFTEADTCTWHIRTRCGLPTITVTDITEHIADNLEVSFIEYAGAPGDAAALTQDAAWLPAGWETAEPQLYVRPERQDVGALQLLAHKDASRRGPVDGSSLYSSLNGKRLDVEKYERAAEEYRNLRLEYNAAVNELQNQLDTAILRNSRPADDSSGLIDQILGWFTEAVAPEEEEVPELLTLPPRPAPPVRPEDYAGADISALKAELGYGVLSAGKISLRSHHGVKKFFGVGG